MKTSFKAPVTVQELIMTLMDCPPELIVVVDGPATDRDVAHVYTEEDYVVIEGIGEDMS